VESTESVSCATLIWTFALVEKTHRKIETAGWNRKVRKLKNNKRRTERYV